MSERLDQLLLKKGFARTLKEAHGFILAGRILVDDQVVDKPGRQISEAARIEQKGRKQFVSRGGHKLAAGITAFSVTIDGFVCADIGASSGGFTDCLLQNGAGHVFAVDVAYGQLDWKIRQHSRVTVIERFNARNISTKEIPDPIDLAVIDASFISLTTLLPPLLPLFRDTIRILALIKPQFELGRQQIRKGGVVTDPELHMEAVAKISSFATETLGLQVVGHVPSPILGPKGNREFVIYLCSRNTATFSSDV